MQQHVHLQVPVCACVCAVTAVAAAALHPLCNGGLRQVFRGLNISCFLQRRLGTPVDDLSVCLLIQRPEAWDRGWGRPWNSLEAGEGR